MSGTVERADAVLEACRTWVQHHHQTSLTGPEATRIRARLKERLHDRMLPKATDHELVALAHKLVNQAIDARRDQVQRGELARVMKQANDAVRNCTWTEPTK